jgi:flagellar motor switch protein FliG
MSIDAASASELLKGADPKTIEDLAVELAYLDAAGYGGSKESVELARHFYNSLQGSPQFHVKAFLSEMLRSTVGKEKAEQIQSQIQGLLQKRDPFIPIRAADSQTLSAVLDGEHPQVVAVVLSELAPKKSSEVLGLLAEDVRLNAVSRMAGQEPVTPEAKARIAQMVSERLSAARGGAVQARPEESLRKTAVILRNLGKELRDGLLAAIKEKDSDTAQTVSNLMVVWDDLPQVADKPLQEALRGIDARQLALALFKADEAIVNKIRSNISERAAAMLDEEASLMSAPKKEDIEKAREQIVNALREMNQKGELAFIEE